MPADPAPRRARLTRGPEGRALRSLLVPTLLGMLAMALYNVADTWFVAQLGTVPLAALGFSFPVVFVMGAITVGLGHGTTSVCARLFGSDDVAGVRRVTAHALLLGLAVGLVVLVAGLASIDPLFRLLGADDTTLPYIRQYMRIYYVGGVALVVTLISNPVLRAAGDARTPARLMAASALLNVSLDPVLIFGLFGAPRLGIEGAAISTLVANTAMLVASLTIMGRYRRLLDFSALAPAAVLASWRRILHVGIPAMGSSVITPVTTAFITWQLAQFGQAAVAGFGVAARVESLAVLPLTALGVAVLPFVGQNYGAGLGARVAAGLSWARRFAVAYGLLVAALLALLAPALAGLFADDAQAVRTTVLQLRIVPASYLALGLAITSISAFNAINRPLPALGITLVRTALVYAPLAWLLARWFGIPGVFAAACTANLLAGGLGLAWFRQAWRGLKAGSAAPSP